MTKAFVITFLLLLFRFNGFTQSIEDLQRINSKSKTLFVKPEILDQLLIDLRTFENSPQRELDTLLLETYHSIASVYMANNHFKKAYEVFTKYLNRKEAMLLADKKASVDRIINSVSGRQQVDINIESDLQKKVAQLKIDNELLESRRKSFKRNFSFALIFLTGIFAIMLVSGGVRLMTLGSTLQQNREKMKNIHRKAVVGGFTEGLESSIKTNLSKIEEETKELQQSLKKQEQSFSPAKQANQLLAGIEKVIKELKDSLRV